MTIDYILTAVTVVTARHMGVSGAIRHTTVLKTVRQCKSHWIHTMNLILGESLLAIKLNLIMMSL